MRHSSALLSPTSDMDWRDSYPTVRKSSPFNTVFSDDEEEDDDEFDVYGIPSSPGNTAPRSLLSLVQSSTSQIVSESNTSVNNTFPDPLVNSTSYHIHVAETALSTLKRLATADGWKKALRHKSGVVVYMKKEKTPIFKGEAVIEGFSPQSVFYVVGMRKLWDQQYEDGNLVENLNETTSLTYEVTKATATSKPRDFALVERIECTPNGSIIFVSTSVETPRMPRIQGRVRAQIKLQGWVLEPVRGSIPATRVTYMIQENMKGWVPGLAKKTLARRPLVIALVSEYLRRKSERLRTHDILPRQASSLRRPSVMSSVAFQSQDNVAASNTRSSSLRQTPASPKTSSLKLSSQNQRPILVYTSDGPGEAKQRRITFADRNTSYPASAMPESPVDADFYMDEPTKHPNDDSDHPRSLATPPPTPSPRQNSSHRHTSKKVACMQSLKRMTVPITNESSWKFCGEHHGVRTYTDGNFYRGEGVIEGKWSPEQLCSVIQCFGARKIWDDGFERGKVMERFSQKDYLVHWSQHNSPDVSAITTIDMDAVSGTVYTATTSVDDPRAAGSTPHAWIDLYGWAFTTSTDKDQRRGVKAIIICQRKEMIASVEGVRQYLKQCGCPPYIRRVAGKVTQEEFDPDTLSYHVALIAKHEPSNAYRARKKSALQWYTDIRFSQKMYPRGFQLSITPSAGTKVFLSPEQTHLKIYTDSEAMNGRPIQVDLTPTHNSSAVPAYTCNGHSLETANTSTTDLAQQPTHPLDQPRETASIPPKQQTVKDLAAVKIKAPVHDEKAAVLLPPSPPSSATLPSPTNSRPTSENTLRVPKGYVLVPQHQVNKQNILILSDDLTFNGQQLAVAFIAMMLCYCMGKFACTSCAQYN